MTVVAELVPAVGTRRARGFLARVASGAERLMLHGICSFSTVRARRDDCRGTAFDFLCNAEKGSPTCAQNLDHAIDQGTFPQLLNGLITS